VGHRGWDSSGQEPLFWFGHGLGYSTWRYESAELSASNAVIDCVRVTLTNTGRRTSRETVQVYLRPDDSGQPVRLIGWAGATVQPGATATLDVPCDARVQRLWDTSSRTWTSLTSGTVLVARSLGDVRITEPWTAAIEGERTS
jgi:beta-glucosidase